MFGDNWLFGYTHTNGRKTKRPYPFTFATDLPKYDITIIPLSAVK